MYWIIESVNSLVFMFCVFILLKMQKKGMISTFFYFFFLGGLTSLFILYSKNLCSYYDLLEFNADMIKNVVGLGFGVNVILLIIFLSIHIWVKQTKKSEIAVVHNIRILPFCSVQYVMVIIGIIFSLLCFIDHIMPQYGLWTVDNHNIQLEKYGYHISVIDLRNPTRSNGNNLLHLVNKYMDLYKEHSEQLVYKAKAEKYAKIISKTIILSGMEAGSFGQNAFFYDAAEGLLTATILLVAEFCPAEKRHIVSVFKIIQELLAPPDQKQG